MMNKSRPDLSLRLELVQNRMKYLDEVWARIHEERNILKQEQEHLVALGDFYKQHQNDAIDEGRRDTVDYLDESPMFTGPVRTQVIDALRVYGPMSLVKLSSVLNMKQSSISSALYRMRKDDEVIYPTKRGGVYKLPKEE